MCSACAERDVRFARDVCFASDVRFARESGTHHITLRHSRNTSLFTKQTASLAPKAQTSRLKHSHFSFVMQKKSTNRDLSGWRPTVKSPIASAVKSLLRNGEIAPSERRNPPCGGYRGLQPAIIMGTCKARTNKASLGGSCHASA